MRLILREYENKNLNSETSSKANLANESSQIDPLNHVRSTSFRKFSSSVMKETFSSSMKR